MENAKGSPSGDEAGEENSDPTSPSATDADSGLNSPPRPPPSRTPFTSLSQVDADLALARTLQEQERAYLMLRMNGAEDGSDYATSEDGSFVYEDEVDGDDPDHPAEDEGSDYGEDAFDANDDDRDIDPAEFENDEAFARALQDAEEREVAVRLMALTGLNDWSVEDLGDHGSNSQDTWQDVDPDELSYEELVALGEVVGTESRGLSADTIASLPSVNYNAQSNQDDNPDPCVICRLDYENGDSLVVLPCKHTYHSECINKWLQINKICPVCSAEVSTSGGMQD